MRGLWMGGTIAEGYSLQTTYSSSGIHQEHPVVGGTHLVRGQPATAVFFPLLYCVTHSLWVCYVEHTPQSSNSVQVKL